MIVIVLIRALPRLSFRAEDTDHRNGMFRMRMTASKSIVVAEELGAPTVLADDGRLWRRCPCRPPREGKTAPSATLPVADLLELRARLPWGQSAPVQVSRDHLIPDARSTGETNATEGNSRAHRLTIAYRGRVLIDRLPKPGSNAGPARCFQATRSEHWCQSAANLRRADRRTFGAFARIATIAESRRRTPMMMPSIVKKARSLFPRDRRRRRPRDAQGH